MKFFKDHTDYLNKRNSLIEQAQEFLKAEKQDEYKAKFKEIETLDSDYKDFAEEQANLKALQGGAKPSIKLDGNFKEGAQNMFDTIEYRNAFMQNVLHGKAIPNEYLNSDANTKTSDAGAVIPTTVLDRIIDKMESVGMILPLVTRTAYKGGLTIPTSSVKPTASWVAEGVGSDRQKKSTGSITFAYHKLRCAVSVSWETETMALSAFETAFVNNVAEAMTKALEQAIISGDGSGKPKGILAETVVTGQNVDVAEGASITYADLCDMESKLPLAYENGAVWLMTKATFMKIIAITDSDGQPIARVNYGIGGKPERTVLGRTVVLNDYMPSYSATVSADTVIACLFNMTDYVLNTNLDVTIKKYEDNDTDDIVTKAIMLVDGKVVDKNSLVTMTLKNA